MKDNIVKILKSFLINPENKNLWRLNNEEENEGWRAPKKEEKWNFESSLKEEEIRRRKWSLKTKINYDCSKNLN